MIKRTILVLVLILLVPVALTGCGDSEKNKGNSDGGPFPDGAVLDGGWSVDMLQATEVGGKPDVAITSDTRSLDGGGTVDMPIQLDAGIVDALKPLDTGAVDAHSLDGSRLDAETNDERVDAATNDGGAFGLNGSTVTATLYNPDLQTILGGPATAVVGASTPTFPNGSILGNSAFEINITGNQIIYSPLANVTYGNGTFNGFVFVFANAPTILGVALDPASNFNPTNISFTGNSVSMNLSANTVATNSVAILDLQLAP